MESEFKKFWDVLQASENPPMVDEATALQLFTAGWETHEASTAEAEPEADVAADDPFASKPVGPMATAESVQRRGRVPTLQEARKMWIEPSGGFVSEYGRGDPSLRRPTPPNTKKIGARVYRFSE